MRTILGIITAMAATTLATTAAAQSTVDPPAHVDGSPSAAAPASATVTTSAPSTRGTGTIEADGSETVGRRAPRRAFELTLSGGYLQPFGEIADQRSIAEVGRAGGALGLEVGWRVTPRWSVGAYGQVHQQDPARQLGDATVRGMSVGVMATYHMRPYRMVDPYISFGSGYRFLWVAPADSANDVVHGLELGRGVFGVDFRVGNDVALGPVIGADLNLLFWENRSETTTESATVDAVRPNTFLFAGMSGRFDIGGRRVGDPVRNSLNEPVASNGASR